MTPCRHIFGASFIGRLSRETHSGTCRCECRRHPHPNKLYLDCYCACRRHQGCHCRKRRLRYVADFWAALGQAAACLYPVRWGVGRKAQWRVEKLSPGHGAAGPGRAYIFQPLISLIGPSVPMSVCHRPIAATHGAGRQGITSAPACHREGVSNVHCAAISSESSRIHGIPH